MKIPCFTGVFYAIKAGGYSSVGRAIGSQSIRDDDGTIWRRR